MGQKSMQNRLKTQCFQWFAYNHWYKNPGMQVETEWRLSQTGLVDQNGLEYSEK